MNNFNSKQVFVYLVFPISIIVFGLIGNTTGLLVLFKKKMKKKVLYNRYNTCLQYSPTVLANFILIHNIMR